MKRNCSYSYWGILIGDIEQKFQNYYFLLLTKERGAGGSPIVFRHSKNRQGLTQPISKNRDTASSKNNTRSKQNLFNRQKSLISLKIVQILLTKSKI